MFPTSKLWYKAFALPLPGKYAKMFESAMVHFLWIKKLEKLKLDEINILFYWEDLICPVSLRRVEKFKNSRRNIFRVGKYVYVLGGLKKVV